MTEKLKLVREDERGNKIFIGENVLYDDSLIMLNGSNNIVEIGSDSNLKKFKVSVLGNFNSIIVGARCNLTGVVNVKKNGKKHVLRVGDETSFQGVSLYLGEGRSITIGRDCMFSARIEIRTTDSHSVIDIDTGQRINAPGSVVIGDHVWLGKDVIVSKGVTLKSNVIVGAKAFVNRSFDESYIAIAGVPAKTVKSRVDWSRELLPMPHVPND